ncbi:MAG: HgcAB-associated protein [Candidatus Bipolaricaulota bacterium]|nr:HgcAB-associated protein [Candidatus Bipolaricaulota bacterium]
MSDPDEKVGAESAECCEVAAVVRVDERGQMVLPKDIRERMGLGAGDKLALTAIGSGDKICCLVLVKADALVDGVRLMIRAVTQGS